MNDPSILPANSPYGEKIETEGLVAEPNIYLSVEGGALLFAANDDTTFNFHPNFLPGWRGEYALDHASLGMAWMFCHTPCMRLTGRLPADNTSIIRFFGKLGFTKEFTKDGIWPSGRTHVALDFVGLDYDTWYRSSDALVEIGKEFAADVAAQIDGVETDMEEFRCRALGALVAMIRGGQMVKAVLIYNRFARFALLPEMAVISPNMLDVGNAILLFKDHGFKVIKCR